MPHQQLHIYNNDNNNDKVDR